MPSQTDGAKKRPRVKPMHGPHENSLAGRRAFPLRRQVAAYPCPVCSKRMYADEVVDFGTITVDGDRKTGKYHRDCNNPKE